MQDMSPGGRPRQPWRPKGLLAGALLGVLAVVASGLLGLAGAPPAYGICVACHGRDLLAGLGLGSLVGAAGAAAGFVATPLGLVVGALLAAKLHREWRWRRARQPLQSFLLGLLTMCAGLLALGCTTRLALRAAYGDLLAVWSLAGAAAAVAGVTYGIAWWARRSVDRGDAAC